MAGNPWDAYYDELRVGESHTSIARTITEADVVGFANATGCWFPLHTDHEFAADTHFGEPVVQVTFLLGLAEGLLFRNGPSGIRANVGMDDIRFERPVFVGDTVRYAVEVTDKSDRDEESGFVTIAVWGIDAEDRTFLSYTGRLLVVTRAAAGKGEGAVDGKAAGEDDPDPRGSP